MARVSPEDGNYSNPQYSHHVPNPRHYDDLGVSNRQKRELVGFERSVNTGQTQRQRGGGGGGQPQYAPRHYTPKEYHYEGNMANGYGRSAEGKPSQVSMVDDQKSFIQCDCVAFLIILAWMVAMCSIVLGSLAYKKDSEWNQCVHGKSPLPKLEKESYFSGKHLHFSITDVNLQKAKMHLLREDRWLELVHLIFLGIFLFATLFQFAVYISRGKEDHGNSVKFYYAAFGLLALVCAFFPFSSWKTQETSYDQAAKHLHDFSETYRNKSSTKEINNATVNDAHRISLTMKFCKKASAEGLTFNAKPPTIELFGIRYSLEDLQELGFCTHNRFKVASSVLTLICAVLCCIIPFIYCFEHKGDDSKEFAAKSKAKAYDPNQMYQQHDQEYGQYEPQPPPPQPYSRPPTEETHQQRTPTHHRPKVASHYEHEDGTQLTDLETTMIDNFKAFIEAEDD